MKVFFLGTGTSQGIPVIGSNHPVCKSTDPKDKRLRVSVRISWGNFTFVIDCGPDFRQQMLNSHTQRLDGILFTHEHSDHTAGLDDIRPYNFAQGAMKVFLHERVLANLEKRFDYIFEKDNRYPGAPSVDAVIVKKNQEFLLGNKIVMPIDALHGDLQVFGYRIENFAYLTDIKTISIEEINKLTGVKVLVVSALMEEPHHSHFNLADALNFIKKVNPEKAYLTHISHKMGFHQIIEQKLPKNVFVAYDNLEITI
ncbi:MBL fold metallo-hydrolase [Flavobacterium sp. NST-5]|uniref:MBL fold metallo-hydrolase n=1 Tax=Flavobacterium ichthyis TaxID=2698827 RepID=A0ABW9Z5Q0_9FLAO|nr:MBL fold metallo-hydrolase [Flavobacterium ichthyis]NBL63989.1 MBL fold metallo-hydrolase [Flavobacterium ichthyis]